MIVSAQTLHAAKQNGTDDVARAAAEPGERWTRADAVVDLLAESTSPAAHRGARALLLEMAAWPWDVIRGVHVSPDDSTRHVTIEVARTRYHLRPDARGCVFDITAREGKQTRRPAGHKPWQGPGA